MRNKKSSYEIAYQAAKILSDPKSSKIQKSLAGSALSQSRSDNITGSRLEIVASNVLKSERYAEKTKMLAGSVLSQSRKSRCSG